VLAGTARYPPRFRLGRIGKPSAVSSEQRFCSRYVTLRLVPWSHGCSPPSAPEPPRGFTTAPGSPLTAYRLLLSIAPPVRLRFHGHATAVHEDDFPFVLPFVQNAGLEPILLRGARCVGDPAIVNISDPGGVPFNVNIGIGYFPLKAFTSGMESFYAIQHLFSVQIGATIKHIKLRASNRVEPGGILRSDRIKQPDYRAYYLLFFSIRIHTFLKNSLRFQEGYTGQEQVTGISRPDQWATRHDDR
jgi:hypothetical protein